MFTVNNKDTRRTSLVFLFSIRVFFTDIDFSQDSRGRERTIFYSTLPLPPAHEHRDIYLQLCIWDDYGIFLIAVAISTRLLLDENLPPIGLIDDDAMFVCLLDELILGFLLQRFDMGNRWIELASTITLGIDYRHWWLSLLLILNIYNTLF